MHTARLTPESMLLILSGTGPQQAFLACMILANFFRLAFLAIAYGLGWELFIS